VEGHRGGVCDRLWCVSLFSVLAAPLKNVSASAPQRVGRWRNGFEIARLPKRGRQIEKVSSRQGYASDSRDPSRGQGSDVFFCRFLSNKNRAERGLGGVWRCNKAVADSSTHTRVGCVRVCSRIYARQTTKTLRFYNKQTKNNCDD
jgi:hypothetical protein